MHGSRVVFAALFTTLVGVVSCDSETGGDPPSTHGIPPAAGTDKRISDVTDPDRPDHASYLVSGAQTAISGASVLHVDTFDETGDGKSTGTIFVQDLGSQKPYSGTSLFGPAFVPGNLRVGPGDVLDLNGQYSESAAIGSATFAPGAVLGQLFRPTATFRYEVSSPPPPVEIDVADLADFAKGRRWINMLVTVKNVKLYSDATAAKEFNGRLSAELLPEPAGFQNACSAPFPRPPTLTNELFDLASLDMSSGTTIQSITGIVVFFCNIHLAPRSAADIVR